MMGFQHMVEKQHQFLNLVHIIYERTLEGGEPSIDCIVPCLSQYDSSKANPCVLCLSCNLYRYLQEPCVLFFLTYSYLKLDVI